MPRLRPIHGRDLVKVLCNYFGFVKVLCNYFGFVKVRQRGSHVTLQRNGTFVTVPLKGIRVGLLSRILKDCGISRDDLLRVL